MDWRPTATLATIEKRADLLARIRSFFAASGVMEVDTPLLGATGVPDLHIDCIRARVDGEFLYLQSSPEFYLKRLLAAGCGPVYFLGKAFRDGERGSRHRPEFTLLEWYRPGWDESLLIDQTRELICQLLPRTPTVERRRYGDLFEEHVGLDPHGAELARLRARAGELCGGDWSSETRATLLDLLFSLVVEPQLPPGLIFVEEYPACQAALAVLDTDREGVCVARRFEVFLGGMELGNGYCELTDPVEQRHRFEADNTARSAVGKLPMALDERLLAALASGLPACSGVAIGVDRLLMCLLGEGEIRRVLTFDPGR